MRVLPAVLLLAALALAGCGADPPTATPVVLVVPATPAPQDAASPTAVPASATPDAAATAAVFAQATVAAENAARAALAAAAEATQTEEARPTATPVVLPGVGGTMDLNDWHLSLAKFESRDRLVYNAFGNAYGASGQWVLVWGMVDDHQADYTDPADLRRGRRHPAGLLLGGVAGRPPAHCTVP